MANGFDLDHARCSAWPDLSPNSLQRLSTDDKIQAMLTNSFTNKNKAWKCLITVLPTKSGSDIMFCLPLSSKTLTCTIHLS